VSSSTVALHSAAHALPKARQQKKNCARPPLATTRKDAPPHPPPPNGSPPPESHFFGESMLAMLLVPVRATLMLGHGHEKPAAHAPPPLGLKCSPFSLQFSVPDTMEPASINWQEKDMAVCVGRGADADCRVNYS
jgi:hypothetical protein